MERTLLHNIVLSLHSVHSLHIVLAHSSSSSNYQVLPSLLFLAILSPPQWTAYFPAVRIAIKRAGQSKKDGVGRGLTPRHLVLSSPAWTSSPRHPLQFHLTCALITLPLAQQTSTASAVFSQPSSLSLQSDLSTL